MLEQIDKQIAEIEAKINELIDKNSHWNEVNDILQSIPDVGPVIAQSRLDRRRSQNPDHCSCPGEKSDLMAK